MTVLFSFLVNLLLVLSPQDSDESDSESVQSQVMEAHQSPPAELEEDTAEETDSTVVYNSAFRKPKQTHLFLLDVFYRPEKHSCLGEVWSNSSSYSHVLRQIVKALRVCSTM